MTTYLEPYCVLSDDRRWWPGLILKSISERQEQVAIVIDNERGSTVRTIPLTLAPRQLLVLVADKLFGSVGPGRYSLVISHGPEVHHRLLQAGPVTFNYSTPVEIAAPLPAKPQAADMDKPVQLVDTVFARFNGQSSCRYIRRKYHDQLQAAALATMRLPGRFDNVLNVGDACPLIGSCSGHPSQHSGFYGVDVDYPTTRTNLTQYRVQTGNIFELTNLWDGDVLNGNLDKARCFELWSNLPGTTVSVDPRILTAVQAWATANGKDLSKISGVQGDPNSLEYNHHTHMHIKFNDM